MDVGRTVINQGEPRMRLNMLVKASSYETQTFESILHFSLFQVEGAKSTDVGRAGLNQKALEPLP